MATYKIHTSSRLSDSQLRNIKRVLIGDAEVDESDVKATIDAMKKLTPKIAKLIHDGEAINKQIEAIEETKLNTPYPPQEQAWEQRLATKIVNKTAIIWKFQKALNKLMYYAYN